MNTLNTCSYTCGWCLGTLLDGIPMSLCGGNKTSLGYHSLHQCSSQQTSHLAERYLATFLPLETHINSPSPAGYRAGIVMNTQNAFSVIFPSIKANQQLHNQSGEVTWPVLSTQRPLTYSQSVYVEVRRCTKLAYKSEKEKSNTCTIRTQLEDGGLSQQAVCMCLSNTV